VLCAVKPRNKKTLYLQRRWIRIFELLQNHNRSSRKESNGSGEIYPMLPILKKASFSLFTLFFTSLSLVIAVSAQERGERIVNKVPTHLPVEIEIRNNDLESKLENTKIKVTNVGTRPIYFLLFALRTTDDFPKVDGHKAGLGTELGFGARHLRSVNKLATSDDASLKPGDSTIFDIDEKDVKGLESLLHRKGITDPPRLDLIFQILSFGDGTGFMTTGGTKFPYEKKGSSFYQSTLPDFFPISRAE
jgi:hypothetical protein